VKRAVFALAIVLVALLLGASVLLSLLRPPRLLTAPERGAVFENVTVVEPGVGRARARRVTVEGGLVVSVEPAAESAPAEGFLLPGLVDMHVHGADESIEGQADLYRLLYLAHGVTTLRNTGGGRAQLIERDRIARGEIAGPRLFACGGLVDGEPPVWAFSTTLEDPAGAEPLIAEHVEAGFDCLKLYERLRPDVASALVRAARERGLRVVGHVPQRVRLEDSGIDDIQHLRGVERIAGREPVLDPLERAAQLQEEWAALSPERIDFAVRNALREGTVHTPTLVLFDRNVGIERPSELIDAPEMRLLPRFYGEITWDPRGTSWFEAMTPAYFENAREAEANAKRLVLALFRAGVRIHAGTDVGNPYLVPGAALWEELRHLVDAGLTAEEALTTATAWPGEWLAEPPRLGRIEPGAPADLLLFREDPTQDLLVLGTLVAVVADGRRYSRETLDAALETAERHYRGRLYERVSMAIGERRRAEVLRRANE